MNSKNYNLIQDDLPGMMIPDEHLVKLQEIYKMEFNVELSKKDALKVGTDLLNLVETLLKYAPVENQQNELDRC